MADFTQSIDFRGDFRGVDKEAQSVASRAGKTIEGAYQRVLSRLSGVQGNLVRVTQRLAGGIAGGLGSIAGSVGKGVGSLLTVSGALGTGVTAGIGAATGALGSMIDKADSLSKLKVFDPTTYQRLAIVAEKADASIEDVEKASLTLNKALDATKIPDTLASALKDAGIAVADLKAAKPEQQFHMIADAVSKVKEPSEQAALALQIFGESGVKLVPFLKDGGEAIKTIGDTAQKQGRIIGQTAIDASAALNDSIDAIKEPLAGIASQVLTGIIPRVAEGLDGLVGWLDEHRDTIIAGFQTVTNAVSLGVDAIGRVVTTLVPVFEAAWTQVDRITTAFFAMFGGVGDGTATLEGFIATLAEYLVPTLETTGDIAVWLFEHVLAPAVTIVSDLWTTVEGLATALGFVGESGGTVSDVLSGIASIVTGTLGRALDTLVGSLRTIISLFNTFTTGTWEDAFVALGNALLDFILQPLRSIVGTVVTIADAIDDDLIPQSVRDFAEGGGIQQLAREARDGGGVVPVELPTQSKSEPDTDSDLASQQYGPERPPPSTSKSTKGGGKAKGKAGGAAKAGGGADENLIKIAARGLPGMPLAFAASPSTAAPGTNAIPNVAPTLALALSPSPQSAGPAPIQITVASGAVNVEVNGADTSDPRAIAKSVGKAAEDAVAKALNRMAGQLNANRRNS